MFGKNNKIILCESTKFAQRGKFLDLAGAIKPILHDEGDFNDSTV